MDRDNIYSTNRSYWNDKGNEFLETVTLPNLGAFITDEKHNLFGNIAGKTMLELGCGNGKSMIYNAELNAADLWGVDISEDQLANARRNLD